MKKFGFKKGAGDDTDDASRSALFGSRKKDAAKAALPNPYATPGPGTDPYAKTTLPPAYPSGGAGYPAEQYRRDKSPAVTGPSGAYGRGAHGGNGRGYGGNPYGRGAAAGPDGDAGPRWPGGYGGMGRTGSQDTMSTEAGRDALFGNAPQRNQQQSQQPPPQGGAYGGGASGAYDPAQSGGYGAYADRQLTEEEQEEEDIQATKQDIKSMKQQDVASTRNALRLAQQAEESGMDTLGRLGAQGERIHNTERNLDAAAAQSRISEKKAKELKTLNRSMFAVHVANPFTSESRRRQRDQDVLDQHQQDRDMRDRTRKAAWDTAARGNAVHRDLGAASKRDKQASLAERAKYQFEADSSDEEKEAEIDANLDALTGAAKRLNMLGRAMGDEVESQNQHIDRIIGKTDKVDDHIAMNRSRLDRIH